MPLLAAPVVYFAGRAWRKARGTAPAGVRWLALLTILATAVVLAHAWPLLQTQGPLVLRWGDVPLQLDYLSFLVAALAVVLVSFVLLLAHPDSSRPPIELYAALLLASAGAIIGLSCAADLFNLWLWLELIVVLSYLLLAAHRERPAALEATMHFWVQSAIGSLLALLAIAFLLASTGTLALEEVRVALRGAEPAPAALIASALFLAGFGVKAALVPMHRWLVAAYTEAPDAVSALMAGIITKTGIVALLRVYVALGSMEAWGLLLLTMGALNMVVGNVLALSAWRVKRILAYSSLVHVGYIVLALGIAAAGGQTVAQGPGLQGALLHVLTHGLMIALAFAAGGVLHATAGDEGTFTRTTLVGAGGRAPLAAAAFTVALLSLAGIPPLVGFLSKWQILSAGVASGSPLVYAFTAFAVANSIFALGYYLPLISRIYATSAAPATATRVALSPSRRLPILLLIAAAVLFGLLPDALLALAAPAGAVLSVPLPG